ncbi:MAG: QcrA and Rieske domain-containing protein [Anaerolineales bacterium]
MPKITCFRITILILISAYLVSCKTQAPKPAEDIPIVPVEQVLESGGIIALRAPVVVEDDRFLMMVISPTGERSGKVFQTSVFPTDVLVVMPNESEKPVVFLGRSPHGGCLLFWDANTQFFNDPCYGSRFELSGKYKFGPAGRDLDQLPARLENGLVWITPKIIYGQEHE